MTTIAFGVCEDGAIVGIELEDDGSLTVTIELEVGEESHHLPASAVAAEIRGLARTEAAA